MREVVAGHRARARAVHVLHRLVRVQVLRRLVGVVAVRLLGRVAPVRGRVGVLLVGVRPAEGGRVGAAVPARAVRRVLKENEREKQKKRKE